MVDLVRSDPYPVEAWFRDEGAARSYAQLFPSDKLDDVVAHIQQDIPTSWVVRMSDNTLRLPGLEAFEAAIDRMKVQRLEQSDRFASPYEHEETVGKHGG